MSGKNKYKVAILTGGPSNEHVVSVSSGRMVLQNIDARKFQAAEVRITRQGTWQFLPARKKYSLPAALQKLKHQFNIAFIAMHGKFGEDGTIQALLESMNIPYTGSDAQTSAIAIDKAASNAIFVHAGFDVPKYYVLKRGAPLPKTKLPIIIKPNRGGSSVGITVAKSISTLRKALRKGWREDNLLLAQNFIAGREITCGVLEKNGIPFALTPTEIVPRVSKFFDYQAKYQKGGSLEITPPQLSKTWIHKIQAAALTAHQVLGCRGMSRTDFILLGKKLYVLEINTIPGMTPTSLLPQEAKYDGYSFSEMLDLIITAALR